jgi:DNA-binding XRE family transcriptional regulator
MIKPEQCKAARAVLDWSQITLAREAGVALKTVQNFENEKHTPTQATLQVLVHTLEMAGIVFGHDSVARTTEMRGITPHPQMQGREDEIEREPSLEDTLKKVLSDLIEITNYQALDWAFSQVEKMLCNVLHSQYSIDIPKQDICFVTEAMRNIGEKALKSSHPNYFTENKEQFLNQYSFSIFLKFESAIVDAFRQIAASRALDKDNAAEKDSRTALLIADSVSSKLWELRKHTAKNST